MNRTTRPNLLNGKPKISPTTKTKWRKASARRWASAEAEAEAIIDQISLESGSSDDEDILQTQNRTQQKLLPLSENGKSRTNDCQSVDLSPNCGVTALPGPVEQNADEACQNNSEKPSRSPSQTMFLCDICLKPYSCASFVLHRSASCPTYPAAAARQ